MTENEAIMQLAYKRGKILLDPTTGAWRTLEQVRLVNEDNYKLYLAYELAIRVLQEIQLYRTLDTEEECKKAAEIEIPECVASVPEELLNAEITEQEAIAGLYMDQDLLLFNAMTGDSETPEGLIGRGGVICDSYLADEIAIRVLQTISHYREQQNISKQYLDG